MYKELSVNFGLLYLEM